MSVEFTGPRNIVYTSQQEAQAGKAADGTTNAPPGAKPIPVESGNTLSEIAATNQMSLEELYALNPQFDPKNPQQSRNPDLIYPGEVVYVKGGGDANGDGKPDAGTPQATDQAVADYRSAVQAQKDAGGAQSTGQYHAEQVSNAETAMQQAAQAEIAAGASPQDIIDRHGGINADSKVVISVRRAATDQAAAELVEAKKTGSGVEQAQAKLDDAVKKEIEASASLFAPDGTSSRENTGKGAIAAGESIKTRLQEAGLSEEANRVTGIAEQVEAQINNEV